MGYHDFSYHNFKQVMILVILTQCVSFPFKEKNLESLYICNKVKFSHIDGT